jgi:hypothetical protein
MRYSIFPRRTAIQCIHRIMIWFVLLMIASGISLLAQQPQLIPQPREKTDDVGEQGYVLDVTPDLAVVAGKALSVTELVRRTAQELISRVHQISAEHWQGKPLPPADTLGLPPVTPPSNPTTSP